MPKYIIVNADDFGLSPGVNRGIIEAAERGILTSASLMVRQPAAAAAAEHAKKALKISVGLHLDLGEWVYQSGEWVPLYSVVSMTDDKAIAAEIQAQVAQFEKLMEQPPTHLDSHQHVHRDEPVRSRVATLAAQLGIPVREQSPGIAYYGYFYGQTAEGQSMPEALSTTALIKILGSLPEGLTELGCHPGYDDGLATVYRTERALEVQTLCAPEVRAALADFGIELRSFKDFTVAAPN